MTSSILLHWSFLLISISFCYGFCIKSEKDALLQLKKGLIDPSNRLVDWVRDDSDCCRWTGIVCSNLTSGDHHVIELHLRTLSRQEYFGVAHSFTDYDPDYEQYEHYQMKSAFSGKVSSSLLHLNRLSYLDLSFNDFKRVPIPEFFGSMQSLRYLNLSNAGFGGLVPPQLGNLSNLHYLNLQSRYDLYVENFDWISSLYSLEILDMSRVDLSQSFDWLKAMNSLPLVELYLSGCRLSGFNPLPNLNFSSLSVLHLSSNYFEGPIPNILNNMTSSLRELDLSFNGFSSSIPNWLYELNHLQVLNLARTELQGQISSNIANLTSLISLDLSYHVDLEFEFGIPDSFKNLCNLRSLHLSEIKINQEINNILEILTSGCVSDSLQSLDLRLAYNLTGHLSDRIGHLKNLEHLDLSGNEMINGPIPTSFKNLCNLKTISMSSVKLNQEINEVLEIMSECVSNSLQSLRLDNCQLSGHLTDALSGFKNLTFFRISDNSITGPIPSSLGEMVSLEFMDFSNNTLNGTLPISFGDLKKLEILYISDNKLEGEISDIHFANLTRLIVFSATEMGKYISLRVSRNWTPPLQIERLLLGSWHIGSLFPDWLRFLNKLEALDLSNSGISGPVPIWFWDLFTKYKYYYLNFSYNQMNGSIPNISFVNGDMPLIDLSSNNFSGQVPYFSPNVSALDLSNNSFSGSLFNFLCYNMSEEKQMQVLNLERNLLYGEIPDCWNSWKNYLVTIKLSSNKFSGNIPESFGSLTFLESLSIRNNSLQGEIPFTVANCTRLVTLDLSENSLVGNIPTWIGDKLSSLRILSLHENKLVGFLPKELCRLVSLHILDLANNRLFGTIPSCFSNFTGMATRNDLTGSIHIGGNSRGVFIENALLVMKGRVMEYHSILGYVRSIDLSNNNLFGEIPDEITSLIELLSLNLSRNALTGRIPNTIGDMKALEAIDFSHNQLSNEIPQSLSALTFLGTLDLSYNNLSGRIPLGTQLHGFDSTSFIGNPLCGLPLTKNCSSEGALPEVAEDNDEDEDEVDVWLYVNIVFGFVVGFWGAVASLIFIRRWRNFYFRFVCYLGEQTCKFFHRFH